MVSNTMLNTLTGNLLPHAAANRRTPNTLDNAAVAVWRLLSYAFGLAAFWSVLCFFLLFPCFLIMGYLLWVAVIYAVTHCSLSLTFLPSNDRAVRPCLSVVLRVYYVGYIAMCYGSYTGHVFFICYSPVFMLPFAWFSRSRISICRHTGWGFRVTHAICQLFGCRSFLVPFDGLAFCYASFILGMCFVRRCLFLRYFIRFITAARLIISLLSCCEKRGGGVISHCLGCEILLIGAFWPGVASPFQPVVPEVLLCGSSCR